MISLQLFWFGIAVISSRLGSVMSHGRLIKPPQRSSAWRYGFNTPPNFNDNELFCGGFNRQWNDNSGKCGACGDPYDAKEKPNEDIGGRYVTSVITGSYVTGGVIHTTVELTAYHKGWFEFRLCPLASKIEKVTQECLDKTLLKIEGTDVTRVLLDSHFGYSGPGIYNVTLQLPASITCDNCVLQWKYNAGNSWGCESEVKCGIGLGPQENFVNCADIRITDTNKSSPSINQSATMSAMTSSTTDKTSSTSTTESTTTTTTTTTAAAATTEMETTEVKTTEYPTKISGEDFEICRDNSVCYAVGKYSIIEGIPKWCCDNCARNFCPKIMCRCVKLP